MRVQIHSLTARSVPRQFREGLKKGMPHRSDRNIKLWHQHEHQQRQLQLQQREQRERSSTPSSEWTANLHIVYDSERSDVVPYPDAEYVRTPSPEHTGIPARPVKMVVGKKGEASASVAAGVAAGGYSSDDSNLAQQQQQQQQARKLPPGMRRKVKAVPCK